MECQCCPTTLLSTTLWLHAETRVASVSQNDTVESQQQAQKAERGEKTAENIRYGEALSEHGMGGETTGNSGRANQG